MNTTFNGLGTIYIISGPIRPGLQSSQEPYYQVGENGVTRICAYEEPGGLGPAAWFAVWAGSRGVASANALHIAEVVYVKPAAQGASDD